MVLYPLRGLAPDRKAPAQYGPLSMPKARAEKRPAAGLGLALCIFCRHRQLH